MGEICGRKKGGGGGGGGTGRESMCVREIGSERERIQYNTVQLYYSFMEITIRERLSVACKPVTKVKNGSPLTCVCVFLVQIDTRLHSRRSVS